MYVRCFVESLLKFATIICFLIRNETTAKNIVTNCDFLIKLISSIQSLLKNLRKLNFHQNISELHRLQTFFTMMQKNFITESITFNSDGSTRLVFQYGSYQFYYNIPNITIQIQCFFNDLKINFQFNDCIPWSIAYRGIFSNTFKSVQVMVQVRMFTNHQYFLPRSMNYIVKVSYFKYLLSLLTVWNYYHKSTDWVWSNTKKSISYCGKKIIKEKIWIETEFACQVIELLSENSIFYNNIIQTIIIFSRFKDQLLL